METTLKSRKANARKLSKSQLLKRAQDGDMWAQLSVAGMYFLGQGVGRNYDKAVRYWHQGAVRLNTSSVLGS